MARKPRTPPPPRRVQAPRARTGERREGGRPRWLLLVAGLAVVLAAGAIVAGVFAFRSSPSAEEVLRGAGCTLDTFPFQGNRHVPALPEGVEYNSFPPTTGPHHPQPVPFDLYEQPVEQIRVVHNLEHGGVAVQYGQEVPQADVQALAEWWREDPAGLVVAPLPGLGDRIALTAWVAEVDERGRVSDQRGVLASCPGFDAEAFDAFVEEYGFRGPERFPREQLQPGL